MKTKFASWSAAVITCAAVVGFSASAWGQEIYTDTVPTHYFFDGSSTVSRLLRLQVDLTSHGDWIGRIDCSEEPVFVRANPRRIFSFASKERCEQIAAAIKNFVASYPDGAMSISLNDLFGTVESVDFFAPRSGAEADSVPSNRTTAADALGRDPFAPMSPGQATGAR